MGQVQTPQLAQAYLDFGFSEVAVQDLHTVGASLGNNSKVRQVVWEYTKANWPAIEEKLGANKVVIERYLRMSLQKFADERVEADIAKFFEGKDTGGYDRGLAVVSDTIKGNAKYRERDLEVVREWLKAHGYVK